MTVLTCKSRLPPVLTTSFQIRFSQSPLLPEHSHVLWTSVLTQVCLHRDATGGNTALLSVSVKNRETHDRQERKGKPKACEAVPHSLPDDRRGAAGRKTAHAAGDKPRAVESSTPLCISAGNEAASQAGLGLRWRTCWWVWLTGVTIPPALSGRWATPGPKETGTTSPVFTAVQSKIYEKTAQRLERDTEICS